jgi:putative transposase
MTTARKHLVDARRSACYHLVSRCVRRAFLCGDAGEHRREWIAAAVQLTSRCFAVEVLGFAIMSNHLHLVVKTQPQRAQKWSDQVVAERWAALYPLRGADGELEAWPVEKIQTLAANHDRCAELRKRLAYLSWMMKIIKERIAKRAIREDGCLGHFWEQRFHSSRLADQAALLSCMAYVDLNPIRAKMADRPETSDYTSVHERICARQRHRQACALISAGTTSGDTANTPELHHIRAAGPEHGLFIAPISACVVGDPDSRDAPSPISLDNYLDLVDATGRIIKSGKRGHIPAHLLPILQRLDLDVDAWLALMRSHGRFIGTAIGHYAARAAVAAKRGLNWIRNTIPELFSGRPPPQASAT